MRTTSLFPEILGNLVTQAPVLLICIVAIIFISVQGGRLRGGAAAWALSGFGLVLLIAIAVPFSQPLVRNWADGDPRRLGLAFTVMGIFWSFLRAISYGLLLAAVFVGRPAKPE